MQLLWYRSFASHLRKWAWLRDYFFVPVWYKDHNQRGKGSIANMLASGTLVTANSRSEVHIARVVACAVVDKLPKDNRFSHERRGLCNYLEVWFHWKDFVWTWTKPSSSNEFLFKIEEK